MDVVRYLRAACPLFTLLILAACSSDSGSSGPKDYLVITPTTTTVTGTVGGSQTVALTFNSSDDHPLAALTATDNLGALPAGWSGPASFGCAKVATGSGCVLTLTYAPTSAQTASTLALHFTYVDAAGLTFYGWQYIAYSASSSNNLVATAAPTGQIDAIVGAGSQVVSVNFTTDDGNTASALSLTTNLNALPSGWASSAGTFTCDAVNTGNGCQLNLTYSPVAVASGTLALSYTYQANDGESKTGSINIPYAATTHNNVAATATPSGQVNAIVGNGNQAVLVNFTTDDGNPASSLTLTTDLSTLPAGWNSSVTTLACAVVSTGNGCELPLSFQPTTVSTGTVTLTYSYQDDSGTPKTGAVSIPYASTAHDNVVATASPSGQINAIVGAPSQAVTVTFTTDDGNTATALTLTSDLTALPTGWSSSHTTFTCTTLSTGSGCQLLLDYTPAGATSGALTLTYAYQDNSGAAKTGTFNVPYAATTHNGVVGTSSPTGQINSVVGAGSQPVAVIFTTNDGSPATNLSVTSDLTALPAGWSSNSSSTIFTCTAVSIGNGCQLQLAYQPATPATGTLTLSYAYQDDSGTAKTGTVAIAYTSTEHDNVVGTASPSSQVTTVVGSNPVPVVIDFTTDDQQPAHSLAITSNLAALPGGWTTNTPQFACGTVTTGTSCELALSYAPTAGGSGTLSISYTYSDDAGTPKAGTVQIPYNATSHDNVIAAVSPSTVAAKAQFTQTVTVTFTTDDSLTASQFYIDSGLTTLPAGWSTIGNTFTCASVNVGSGCQLTLTYSPTATTAASTLSLHYQFLDDAGANKSNTVTVHYSTAASTLYAVDYNTSSMDSCPINADGTLGTCQSAGLATSAPYDFRIINGYFLVGVWSNPSYDDPSIWSCQGFGCSGTTTSPYFSSDYLTINAAGTVVYDYDDAYGMLICQVVFGYEVNSCSQSPTSGLRGEVALSSDGSTAYVASASQIDKCSVTGTAGQLTSCSATGSNTSNITTVFQIVNSRLYALDNVGNIYVCPVNSDRTLGSCSSTSPTGAPISYATFTSRFAYLTASGNSVLVCALNADGTVGTCNADTDPVLHNMKGVHIY